MEDIIQPAIRIQQQAGMELFTAVFFSVLTPVRLEECKDSEMGWKGNHVKALHDCDLLRERSTIRLNDLVLKPQCVNFIRLNFRDSDGQPFRAGPVSNPEREVNIGTRVPNKCLSHDVTVFVKCDCTGKRHFESKFILNPMKCSNMRREINFTVNEKANTAVIDNEYFHTSNNYVSLCMRSVSLINSNSTVIDNRWRKEYKVPIDRCKN